MIFKEKSKTTYFKITRKTPVLSGLDYVTGMEFWTLLGKHKRLWAPKTSAGTTEASNPGEQ